MNCNRIPLLFQKKKENRPNRRKNRLILVSCIVLFGFLLSNCNRSKKSDGNELVLLLAMINQDPGEAYSGGWTTVFDTTSNAFTFPVANLRDGGSTQFNVGNTFFNTNWTQEGNSALSGKGPTFNASSCQACHQRSGRGAPPNNGATPAVYGGSLDGAVALLVRLSKDGANSVTGGPIPTDNYGLQLNHQGIASFTNLHPSSHTVAATPVEGHASVSYSSIAAPVCSTCSGTTYPDGTVVYLSQPTYSFSGWNFNDPTSASGGFHFSPRVAPPIAGLGLLEAIPESTVLSWADPNDLDGDGISGKPNYVWDTASGQKLLGRFGWKANEPSIAQQNQDAFLGDIGITSPLNPTDNCPAVQTICLDSANGTGDPEIGTGVTSGVIFWNRVLGIPGRRSVTDPQVVLGKATFVSVGCASCHKPLVLTGTVSDFPENSSQFIKPYTDLLLHDMGSGLADGRSDFDATGSEWRTPPLWGIGLVSVTNGHQRFLHDGRANGLEEAILWHAGEGAGARNKFQLLSASDRSNLIKFLNSL
ncbi:thiol oxidoreductase [Leptospira fletcheri]|uniref:Thiol oxidoreductase n=1 Tax=Leptospira fletcheri TaxID=2484981 RepID=A0A4R9GHC4_9LEPT|nr:di-heme oxidoredictase family protein [Leptospira fletcheri]TGK12108.1 thiol oxidoreductase [Leptospira fletcheri]